MSDFKIEIPGYVSDVIKTLTGCGFEGYIVGGCVRDSILGFTPQDWDVATNARPEEMLNIFERCVETGIKHGTVGVISSGNMVEVTTYRVDGEYTDNRHPESVVFSRNLKEDLSRRDFTVNAMAYSENDGLIDIFCGMEDLRNKVIRCVGDANLRFREDALRMMRGVRFAAQLGFDIYKDTLKAIENNAELILNISAERVQAELNKILMSDNTDRLYILEQTGLCGYILPELSLCFKTEQQTKYHIYDVGVHSLKVVENSPKRLNVRLAALMHDFGKPACKTTDEDGVDHFYSHARVSKEKAREVLNRLRYSNAIKESVLPLVEFHGTQIIAAKKTVKRAISKVSDELFIDLLDLKFADMVGKGTKCSQARNEKLDKIRDIYYEIKENNEALKITDLKINGRDLIDMGVNEGQEIGRILNALLTWVLNRPEKNEREALLKRAQELAGTTV